MYYLFIFSDIYSVTNCNLYFIGKGGKNRRRGKNENETEKRELVFREDGQGIFFPCTSFW